MTDWPGLAQARGLTLSEAQARILEALEEDFAPVREGLEWMDEPALEYHAGND
jgi:hypothetical protein